jgi:hypothetical protein
MRSEAGDRHNRSQVGEQIVTQLRSRVGEGTQKSDEEKQQGKEREQEVEGENRGTIEYVIRVDLRPQVAYQTFSIATLGFSNPL